MRSFFSALAFGVTSYINKLLTKRALIALVNKTTNVTIHYNGRGTFIRIGLGSKSLDLEIDGHQFYKDGHPSVYFPIRENASVKSKGGKI